MRKRRRLADKLTIMVCAVLVAVSAFFYVPMDVKAEEFTNSFNSGDKSFSFWPGPKATTIYFGVNGRFYNGSDKFIDDAYYKVNIDYSLVFNSAVPIKMTNSILFYRGVPFIYSVGASPEWLYSQVFVNDNFEFVVNGDFLNSDGLFQLHGSLVGHPDYISSGSFVLNYDFEYSINSIIALTGEESASYQQGYDAGYSAGEQFGVSNGYSNGYSDGFEEGEQSGYNSGFQAGQDSVDTQSYYDMGYSAGYDAGYLSGYDVGYDDGYSLALKSVQGSSSVQKPSIILDYLGGVECLGNPFYVSSYGLIDMEEYQSGVNGYFYNTVPGTYNGTTSVSYNIPLWTLNGNSYPKFEGDKLRVRFSLMSLQASLDVFSGSATLDANLMSSKIREVYVSFMGNKYYGNYSTSTSYADFDFIIDDFVGSGPHTLVDDMTLTFVLENSVTIVTDSDVTHYVSASYTPKVEFDLGRSNTGNSLSLIPYVTNDRVSANIQSQTDSLINGFNDSSGNSVNNDFSSGLNDFETAEDSLFATATTGLKDFTFFDFQSVPAMVTGMSFVGSIMSGWFTQAGGASGVGIVLSILFSIMLVAMVLGLYRWYQSKGGKD